MEKSLQLLDVARMHADPQLLALRSTQQVPHRSNRGLGFTQQVLGDRDWLSGSRLYDLTLETRNDALLHPQAVEIGIVPYSDTLE